ncbi:MAG: hypothetical protein U0556_02980 [Dehalococcoidia bacterium]
MVVLLVRRWSRAVRVVWLLSASTAGALTLPLWPAVDVRIPWIPGSADIALFFSLHVDALTTLFAMSAAVIAVAVALDDLRSPIPWRFVLGRQLALGFGLLVMAAANLAVAASLLLVLPLAAGLARRFDDEPRLSALGGIFAAGCALLTAAAFGVAAPMGFASLVLGLAFLLFQFPFHGLAETALTGLRGAFAINLATIVLPGLAIAVRFSVDSSDPWRLQAIAALGAATMALTGLIAARADSLARLLASTASLQAGACLVALGQGISPTQPAAILIGPPAMLALAGLSLAFDRITEGSGIAGLGSLMGAGRSRPLTGLLMVTGALAVSPFPLIGGAAVGNAVSLAGALSDGRFVLAALALVGLGGAAAGLGRMALTLFAPGAEPTGREQPIRLLAAALPIGVAVAAGVLAFTAIDPAARAAIAAFGARPRPTGGELFALPWYGGLGAFGGLIVAGVVGVLGGTMRGRPSSLPVRREVFEPGLVRLDDILEDRTEPLGEERVAPFETRVLLGRLAGVGRLILWTFAQGLALLEGRYYMATVLVLGLWILIIFLG